MYEVSTLRMRCRQCVDSCGVVYRCYECRHECCGAKYDVDGDVVECETLLLLLSSSSLTSFVFFF